MKQLTQAQAKALYDSGEWKKWTDEQIVRFQLYQDRLCVEWSRFHAAMEKVLGRPVWTHEFAFHDNLVAEYEGKRPRPTFEEIVALMPADKLIVVASGQ